MNYGWLGDSSVASGSSDPGESMGLSFSMASNTNTIEILSSPLTFLCVLVLFGSCCTLALGKVFLSFFLFLVVDVDVSCEGTSERI